MCVYRNSAASMFTKVDDIYVCIRWKTISWNRNIFAITVCHSFHFIIESLLALKIHLFFLNRTKNRYTHNLWMRIEWINFFVCEFTWKFQWEIALFLLYFSGEHLTPHPKLNGKKERFVCIKKDTMKMIVIPKKDELIGNEKIYCKIAVETAH